MTTIAFKYLTAEARRRQGNNHRGAYLCVSAVKNPGTELI
jgi:hypothetical protein